MKASYAVSRPSLNLSSKSRLDLLVSFKAESAPRRRPLNLSLVIDRSGSMAGTSLKQAVKAAQGVVDHMTAEDRLSVVIYDDSADTIVEPQLLSDKAAARAAIGKVHAGGCTNLTGGWQAGCTHVAKHKGADQVNRVLLLTDGQANVGVTEPVKILEEVRKRAGAGVATTTLGFGSNFNEDLLIGMAAAGEGNFYFIESPEDAASMFQIEVEGLASVAAQDLQVELKLEKGVRTTVLNQYRIEDKGGALNITLGDVYGIEEKLLALELEVDAPGKTGPFSLGKLHYRYKCDVDGKVKESTADLALEIEVNDGKIDTPVDSTVELKVSPLRIAKVKNEAVSFADKGELAEASSRLRAIIDALKASPIVEKFEIAEELAQLEHYAERLEKRSFDGVLRKEMMDQAYQARNRNRSDLNLRGTAGGSTAQLAAVSEPGTGVVVKCEKESGRLRIRVTSDGYDKSLHVQFPRAIREEGSSYVVESIVPSKDGSYYRAVGKISLLLLPGQTRSSAGGSTRARSGKASTVSCTAADLPTTNAVGDGILVQCVKEGPKLRARVVSDGYDPNFNMRFPRSIRELGVLYVVDNVIVGPNGNSYIACGDIKRLIQ